MRTGDGKHHENRIEFFFKFLEKTIDLVAGYFQISQQSEISHKKNADCKKNTKNQYIFIFIFIYNKKS